MQPLSALKNNIFVGLSGFTYPGWKQRFYPKGLKAKDELAFASRKVSSIEINGTFYSLFKPAHFAHWYDVTPEDFVFAIKGPKYITHERRLKDCGTPLASFFASGLSALSHKLGCILWQIPKTLPFKPERMEAFFKALPHTGKSANDLAQNHSEWMKERTLITFSEANPIRHAIEVRHESFMHQDFYDLCKAYQIAIVCGHREGVWPFINERTSQVYYLRLHGDEATYKNGYATGDLKRFIDLLKSHHQSCQQMYVYFDNDVKETAPENALSFIDLLFEANLISQRDLAPFASEQAPKKAKKAS